MNTRTSSSSQRLSWLLGLMLAAAGLTAQAQMGPPPTSAAPLGGQGTGMHDGHGAMQGRMAERVAHMRARHAQHLQELKAKLQITPAQEGAWNSFSAAMQPPTPPAERGRQAQEMAQLSTPERLDRMKALRTQRQAEMNAAMDRRAEAAKTFYASLTPEQKKVFDSETARMMRPGGPQGRSDHHHGGEHGNHS